jgi:hypothetical protein
VSQTPDAVPFVGDVPEKPGQYIAAGYNGHGKFFRRTIGYERLTSQGMVRIFLCAPALAQYMLDGEWQEEMPKSFRVTQDRIDRLRKKIARKEQETKESVAEAGPPLEDATIV